MAAQVYCLLTAVLLCLSGYLSTTDATQNQTVSGYCPDKLTVQRSSQGCSSDGDCSSGYKCCQFDRVSVCVPPVSTKPGECPPEKLRGSCTKSCTGDSECPNNERCCSNGPGHCCTAPYTVMLGLCPKPKLHTPVFAKICSHDDQCPAKQKCCPTSSGRACSKLQWK